MYSATYRMIYSLSAFMRSGAPQQQRMHYENDSLSLNFQYRKTPTQIHDIKRHYIDQLHGHPFEYDTDD
jgi:hypothetical protein